MSWFLLALKRTFQIRGRSRRKEYWMYTLFATIITILLMIIDSVAGWMMDDEMGVTSTFFIIGTLITNFTVSIRRLHDIGRSGWWILLNLIPIIGTITIFVFTLLDSTPGMNKYGPNPKDEGMDYY